MPVDKKESRTRNWATIVYPESAPDNWFSLLEGLAIPAFVSPLHDSDVWRKEDEELDPAHIAGKPKKAHWHVILMYEGPKTQQQADKAASVFGGVKCVKVNSLRGTARYLCHLDNPDKHRYDTGDVTAFCGADYAAVISLTSDKYHAITEMMDFIDANQIYSFAQLVRYARRERNDWFRVLCDNGTYVIREYLKSMAFDDDIFNYRGTR